MPKIENLKKICYTLSMQIFYSWTAKNSIQFLDCLLKRYFNIIDYTLCSGTFGKKYIILANGKIPLHFSITHSKNLLAIAFFKEAIGIDAEWLQNAMPKTIFKNLSHEEQQECATAENFYKNWTAKEAFVKLHGKSMLQEVRKLNFIGQELFYAQQKADCFLQFNKLYYQKEAYIVALCTQRQTQSVLFTEIDSI